MNDADSDAQLIDTLLELTAIPTVAGREGRVVAWVERWVEARDDLEMIRDRTGNLTIRFRDRAKNDSIPIYLTAHMDHPGFVVERIIGPATVELAFRGGVMDDYFPQARIEVITRDEQRILGTIVERTEPTDASPFKHYLCDLDEACDGLTTNDIARWHLPKPTIRDGQLHTNACDDLAAAACALEAIDRIRSLRERGECGSDVRVLLTRAEEIGFIGAIAAVRHSTIAEGAKVIALENSRAFPEAPIGGGPIVRVGDRLTIFSPRLTDDIARIAEDIAGGPSTPTAQQKESDLPAWRWQRKLMAGGACEATVFCHAGLDATCVCLPLGNYHNMAQLDAAQKGTLDKPPRVGPEHISIEDARGMVDLLTACGRYLANPPKSKTSQKIDDLWDSRKGILEE
ncbi:MAG TPA: hypothetical protein ENJ00_10175 [Phycisphaerales bacterium]|nr:hypothetical protein [Phycisphaerales bacterium]